MSLAAAAGPGGPVHRQKTQGRQGSFGQRKDDYWFSGTAKEF